jgi:hypothetical protein
VETTSFLLKKEEMTLQVRREGALKILLKTFSLKNSPSWTDSFLFGKWIEISDRTSHCG